MTRAKVSAEKHILKLVPRKSFDSFSLRKATKSAIRPGLFILSHTNRSYSNQFATIMKAGYKQKQRALIKIAPQQTWLTRTRFGKYTYITKLYVLNYGIANNLIAQGNSQQDLAFICVWIELRSILPSILFRGSLFAVHRLNTFEKKDYKSSTLWGKQKREWCW